jgi:threonylcarbamoyladenosine tRNA methylthiotransferase MtaB
VLSEVRRIAESGCPEVILTGIETASYGKDFQNGYGLAGLLRDVCKTDGIERIALGSLEPTALKGDFLSAAAESKGKVLPHFHLSVQSGCDSVLHRMRRRYNASQVLRLMEEARKVIPGVTFSADVIVGFPGESEEEFLQTVQFCREARFLHLHIFPYSKRKGTEAADMEEQLTAAEKKSRVSALSDVQRGIKEQLMRDYVEAHRTEPIYVLAEEMHGNYMFGHSEHYAEVLIEGAVDPGTIAGKTVAVTAIGLTDSLEVIASPRQTEPTDKMCKK